MISVKKVVLIESLENIKLGNYETITLPFTANEDCILSVVIVSNTSGSHGYLYLKSEMANTNYFLALTAIANGGYNSASVPVKKGDTISVSDSGFLFNYVITKTKLFN